MRGLGISETVLALVALNVVVSIAAFSANGTAQRRHFVFAPSEVIRGRGLLGLLLSHCAHADVGHLLLNLLGLYFFGPVVERKLGSSTLLLVYVASGVLGSLAVLMMRWSNRRYRVLGASGSVTGVLFAAIVLRPDMNLYLFFVPIPVPAPIFAVLYVVLSSYMMGRQSHQVAHDAHLGGAAAGALLAGLISPAGFQPLLERISSWL